MAGLKQSQINDLPVAYWTFDFDQTGLNGNLLIDEIGNKNPMIVNSDTAGDNYWLEQQSLNPLELADQFALSVALDQKVDDHWREQFFEVVHSVDFDFPDRGQFSIEWMMYKDAADDIRNSGEVGQFSNVHTPLFSKGSVVSATISDNRNTTDTMSISVLGRTITLNENTYPLWSRALHCVITYEVVQTDINEYESSVKFWVNGRLIGENNQSHVDNFPNTSTTASWLFAGNGGSNPLTDFATERLTLDQIAVYSYPLTAQQVANHYRKTKQYDQMITDDLPAHYWRLDEDDNPLDMSLNPLVGGVNGYYYGAVNRDALGPERIVTSRAPFFQIGGGAHIDDYDTSSRFDPIININSNYTLEFWFKSRSNDRGILFDCTEEFPETWQGLRVFLNSKNNGHSPGNIQVSESYDNHIASLDLDANNDRYLFNDDEWHHLAVVRDGNDVSLILDGNVHATQGFSTGSIGKPGQIHLMNSRPGDYDIEGYICEIAFYYRALQVQQIYNRYIFSTKYKVAGFTLLQGAPVSATVRFYDTVNGELVGEVVSNGVTGAYEFFPLSNRHLDVISKLPESNTTRYRVHGPVAPAEYDDSHLQ